MGFRLSVSEVGSKLNGCLAKYKGDWYVLSSTSTRVAGRPLANMTEAMVPIDINDPSFTVSNNPQGWLRRGKGLLYVVPSLREATHLGSTCYNITMSLNASSPGAIYFDAPIDPPFLDFLNNKKFSFDSQRLLLAEKKVDNIILSRDFVLSRKNNVFKQFFVYYKKNPVGTFSLSKNKVSVFEGPMSALIQRRLDEVMK